MGFVIKATNKFGRTCTYWVPAKMIEAAYQSFTHDWNLEISKLYSRKPANVDYHIKERI